MWADPLAPLRYPPFTAFNAKLLRFAILYKGKAFSFFRKIWRVVTFTKNLTLLYFVVVGIMQTLSVYSARSPDSLSP